MKHSERLFYLVLFADLLAAPVFLDLAGGLWIAAFAIFLAEHGPMLLRDRKPRG